MLLLTANLLNISTIWVASYCKGTIITAVIFLDIERLLRSGSKNDSVLPVPVGAVTITFLF